MRTPFVKMQGLGNDFIIIDDLTAKPARATPLTPEIAQKICDRRFGIGADQIMWLKKSSDVSCDLKMDILNNDGSIAEMCGNGIRAVALYMNQLTHKDSYRVETLAGVMTVQLKDGAVDVDMGKPVFGPHATGQGESIEAPQLGGARFLFHEISMGNPHAVIFTDNLDSIALERVGPALEAHARFPKRTNVEFVEVTGKNSIRIRVWERGAGITLACGTGACAAAVASLLTSRVESPVRVQLPGGELVIGWDKKDGPVFMQGPAKEVFRGEIEI